MALKQNIWQDSISQKHNLHELEQDTVLLQKEIQRECETCYQWVLATLTPEQVVRWIQWFGFDTMKWSQIQKHPARDLMSQVCCAILGQIIEIDSDAGPKTKEAIKRAQKEPLKIWDDGDAGPLFFKAVVAYIQKNTWRPQQEKQAPQRTPHKKTKQVESNNKNIDLSKLKSRADCIKVFFPFCKQDEANWGPPAEITMAQLILECLKPDNRGLSKLWVTANNFFWIKYFPNIHGKREYVEAYDDRPDGKKSKFIKFESPLACLKFRNDMFNKWRYKILHQSNPPTSIPKAITDIKTQERKEIAMNNRNRAIKNRENPTNRRSYWLRWLWYATDNNYGNLMASVTRSVERSTENLA